MTLKRTQVILLPTNEKASCKIAKSINYKNTLSLFNKGDDKYNQWIGQHLYFLSNEEIKEGDWYCFPLYKGGYAIKQYNSEKHFEEEPCITLANLKAKKIIATTDSSLTIEKFGLGETAMCPLPQPSQDFIKVFVEEYNKGNVIEWVDVEYELYCSICDTKLENKTNCHIPGFCSANYELKVNSKNEITIRKIKDFWSREEVIELLSKYFVDAGSKIGLGNNVTEFTKKWISENL